MVILDDYQRDFIPKYATFGDRILSGILDSLVLGFIYGVVKILSFGLISSVLISWLYYAGMESSSSRGTFGRSMTGTYVANLDGSTISFWQATGRFLLRFVSYSIFFLGVFLMFFNDRRQCLHDLLTTTVILKKTYV